MNKNEKPKTLTDELMQKIYKKRRDEQLRLLKEAIRKKGSKICVNY